MGAALKGHASTVKVLLSGGADAAKQTPGGGKTALDFARSKGHPHVVELLGGSEADVEASTRAMRARVAKEAEAKAKGPKSSHMKAAPAAGDGEKETPLPPRPFDAIDRILYRAMDAVFPASVEGYERKAAAAQSFRAARLSVNRKVKLRSTIKPLQLYFEEVATRSKWLYLTIVLLHPTSSACYRELLGHLFL